jgi:hypothetical protein
MITEAHDELHKPVRRSNVQDLANRTDSNIQLLEVGCGHWRPDGRRCHEGTLISATFAFDVAPLTAEALSADWTTPSKC